MKRIAATLLLIAAAHSRVAAATPHVVANPKPLPVALSGDFAFRKTKLYSLPEKASGGMTHASKKAGSAKDGQGKTRTVVQDSSLNFERQYRMFGAVTQLDQKQRVGDYFDFFWRARRPANVSVRFEYRQEKLRASIQAQEVDYADVRGTNKSEFQVVGDEYADYGRVTSWRCLIIENGKIVAQEKSYMWE